MRLKICGMKTQENSKEIASLNPDYLGFIFYKKSKRYFDGEIPDLPKSIKKVGVFVDENEEVISEKIRKYQLDSIQLHGDETPEYCKHFYRTKVKVIKVFSVDNHFDFSRLNEYENVCDYFLFDTKGKEKGGTGIKFNWEILKENKSVKPYFLSGGIGLDDADSIKLNLKNGVLRNCMAIDVNSRFESKSGLKNREELKKFKELIIN